MSISSLSLTEPEAVRELKVTDITTSSISLNWIKPEGQRSFYRVQWFNGSVSGSENVTQTHFKITNLTAGVQYNISVTAVADDKLTKGRSEAVTQYTSKYLNVVHTVRMSAEDTWWRRLCTEFSFLLRAALNVLDVGCSSGHCWDVVDGSSL